MPTDPNPPRLLPQELYAVLEGVHDALIVTDPVGDVRYMNAAAQSLYGFERLASSGRSGRNLQRYAQDTFHLRHEDGSPVPDEEQPFLRALRGEPYRNVTLLVRHRERGEEKAFAFSGTLVDGSPPLNVLTIRDETERWKAERRYRISFETNPAPTLIVGLDDAVLVDANEGLCDMTGLPKEETVGRSLVHLGLLPEHDDLRAAIDGLKEGKGIDQVPTTIDAPGRGRRSVLVSARPIELDGRPCGIFTFLDVTDLRASEALVAHHSEELWKANEELAAFNYSVAHDLRTPLRGIDGFSQVLLDEYGDTLDEEARILLDRVRAAAGKMGELIDALLRLSRFTRHELRHQPVDLSRAAREITTRLRSEEPEREVEVVLEPRVTVHGDPQLLRVVLENLLENAWKYTREREDARIEFGTSHRSDEQRGGALFVRDNGVGFDMRYENKLFAPFGRLHSVDRFPGLGIGLSIVQRVVYRHGGRVWAEGAPGEGATFYFTLDPD